MPSQVAQLVLTLNDLGQITAEHWTNGQREIERILSLHQIMAILQDQKAAIKVLAEREKEKERAAAIARHNKVHEYAAVGLRLGTKRANEIFGPVIGRGRRPDPQAELAKPTKPQLATISAGEAGDIF